MIFEVLLPYGFLLEYNGIVTRLAQDSVLLPYGFLLEFAISNCLTYFRCIAP